MTETPVSRLILNLGIPTTISMLITSIYNMADTYFVGTLGESAQAATGILFTVQAIARPRRGHPCFPVAGRQGR